MSKKIVIYSKTVCPFCVKAKFLLKRKKVKYEEILVNNSKIMEEMMKKSGGMRTVPQIFADDRYVGDCDRIYRLDGQGKLDEMLGI